MADKQKVLDLAGPGLTQGAVLLIDLRNLEVVTSSYFVAAVYPLWDASRTADAYPVLLGGNDAVMDEVSFVFQHNRIGAWRVDGQDLADPRCVGTIEEWERRVLDLAVLAGSVSAATLYETDRSIRPTAWSNRLAELHEQRLLRPTKVGRQLYYAPPWNEVHHG